MLTHPSFMGKKSMASLIPAACLSFLTLGSVSLYARPGELSLPAAILIAMLIMIPVIAFLHVNNSRD